jgi:nicotinic acid mononucleotide adenylyltransferase
VPLDDALAARVAGALADLREPGPPRLRVILPDRPGAPASSDTAGLGPAGILGPLGAPGTFTVPFEPAASAGPSGRRGRLGELRPGGGADAAGPGSVGLLSGSFDPPTVAHLELARGLVRMGCGLVLLVWSVRTLPKEPASGVRPFPPLLDEAERVGCLAALARGSGAIAEGLPLSVALSSHGLIADQAEAAARAFPGAKLVVGMGSDKVLQLLDPRWYEDRAAALDRLTALATVAYSARAGEEEAVREALAASANTRWCGAFAELACDPAVGAVSSREVRRRLRAGEDVSSLVPPEILALLPGG